MRTVPAAILLMVPAMAFAKYGDQVEMKSDQQLPKGWAIVGVKAAAGMSAGAGASRPPRTFIIRNLNGAPYQEKVTVWVDSPVPEGWVVLETKGGNHMGAGASHVSKPDQKVIQCLVE
jgi:hypothetical protein